MGKLENKEKKKGCTFLRDVKNIPSRHDLWNPRSVYTKTQNLTMFLWMDNIPSVSQVSRASTILPVEGGNLNSTTNGSGLGFTS